MARTVTFIIRHPDDTAWVGAILKFRLLNDDYTSTVQYPSYSLSAVATIADGSGSIELWQNALGAETTLYECILPSSETFTFTVPAGTTDIALSTLRGGTFPSLVTGTMFNLSSYNDLADAIATIGATPGTLLMDVSSILSASVVVPSTLTLLWLASNNVVDLDTFTLTVNGSFEAGLYQIFDSSSGTLTPNGSYRTLYPQWFGATGNGVANDAAAIILAYTAATVSGGVLFFPAGTYVLGASITIPANVAVMLAPGAILAPSTTFVVTINGELLSGSWQIFSVAGGGTFVFGSRAFGWAKPEWWGAIADGATDCAAAITAADLAAGTISAGVEFGVGTYKCNSSVLGCQDDFTRWRGTGHGTVLATYSGAGTVGFDFASTDTTPIRGMDITGIWFLGGQGEDHVVRTAYALDGRIAGCRVSDGTTNGLTLRRPQNMIIENNEIRDNGSWGIEITDFSGGSGQTCRIIKNTLFNNGATDGATGGILVGDAAEHVIAWNQFESHNTTAATCCIQDITARLIVTGNTFENNSVIMHLGNGVNTSRRMRFVLNNVIDGKFYAENYRSFLVEQNTFGDNLATWTAEFGSDEGNSLSIWRNNYEDPNGAENGRFTSSAQVGKIQIEGSWDQRLDGSLKPFADGDTSPSVAGGYYYQTQNTSPTSITVFNDWFPGQFVFIRMGDDVTTFVRNANILETATEADITPLTGDVLLFKIVRREIEPGAEAHKAYLIGYLPLNVKMATGAGTFTIKSGNANSADTDGWYQVAPGIWVPYTNDPTP